MMRSATVLRAPRTRRSRFAWVVLLFVQVVVALTPLVEARGGTGAGAHVEARGDVRHYAHAEANCAFCAARTIHAAVTATSPNVPKGRGQPATQVALALLDPSSGEFRSNLSRAPPAV